MKTVVDIPMHSLLIHHTIHPIQSSLSHSHVCSGFSHFIPNENFILPGLIEID